MVLWNVVGIKGVRVINIDSDETELTIGTIIELNQKDWGGGVSRYLINSICHNTKTIGVQYYNKRILTAYPTCETIINP